MAGRDIIVIGGSAGGVQTVLEIIRMLPPDLRAAVFVVIHTSPSSPGVLADLLNRAGPFSAFTAINGQKIIPGRIYVAPPDHQLLIKRKGVRVTRGPKENGFRPAVDPLFRTAARAFGPRVIGVVVSGNLDDGTEGLTVIKEHGGVAVVQDPTEAMFPSMPASAIQNDNIDFVLPVSKIPDVLSRLVREPVPEERLRMTREQPEPQDVAEIGDKSLLNRDLPGAPSGFICPECGGAIWELSKGKLVKYRCHVGHTYTPQGLLAAQTEDVESAMWTALRALEENAAIHRRMAKRSEGKWPVLAKQYEKQAKVVEDRAQVIREVLLAERPEPKETPAREKAPSGDGSPTRRPRRTRPATRASRK